MARVSERRARRHERQSTDERARPNRRGPWRNANNVVLAKDLAELHARKGDPSVFLDEHGQRIRRGEKGGGGGRVGERGGGGGGWIGAGGRYGEGEGRE